MMDLGELDTYMQNMIRHLEANAIECAFNDLIFNEKGEGLLPFFVQNNFVDSETGEEYEIQDMNSFVRKFSEELKSKINNRFDSESFCKQCSSKNWYTKPNNPIILKVSEVQMFDEILQFALEIKLSEDKFGEISSDFPLDRLEELIRLVDDHISNAKSYL